jgi:hypothetical protein
MMNTAIDLSWEHTQNLADDAVFKNTGKRLSDIEVEVLRGAWEGKSYDEIASQLILSVNYINKDVGYRLWKKLSDALGEEVSKKSFRQALQRVWQIQDTAVTLFDPAITQLEPAEAMLEFPDGSVALDSPFYVERPPIESDCYKEILKPGSLIRIRGPRQTGKTSLLNRILACAVQNSYQVVRLNLRKADKSTFADLNKLLRWVCLSASRQLNLVPNLDEYWDEEIGSKVSCTVYFQSHILEKLATNLVISIDEVDTVFNYPDIAEDFLALLREWHEEAMIEQSWCKLRLVIAHSTEVYIPLNIHQSPFNVGLPLRLPQFNPRQVQNLAQLHSLTWTIEDTHQLIAMVGGHPYLIRLALYHLAHQDITLAQLLQSASTHAGVYSDHLRRCLGNVKQQAELASALKQIVSAETPVQLPPSVVYQLDSMGLVYLDGNQISPSCELYRQYFNTNL